MHWHTKRILFKSISAFLKTLCLALPVGMLLAGTAQAQSSADGVTSSDWIHFPARPAKKNLPASPVTGTAATPANVVPLSAPTQTETPKAATAEPSTQKPAAPPSLAGDWVQFPPLPPPKAKPATAKAVAPVNSATERAASPNAADSKPADTAAEPAPKAPPKSKTADATATNTAAPSTDATPTANAPAQFAFKGFKFEGNTVYSSNSLSRLIAKQVPAVKDLSDIQSAAQAVANRYQEDGVLARVDLLPQDLTEGIVTITITEGKFSGARMESANSAKLPPDLLTRMVEKAQPVGAPVRLSNMDRATMLLNEVPGVQANVRLSTGQAEGLVQVQDKNPWDGQLTMDNTGSVSTGIIRFSSQFNRYGLLGRADAGSVQYMHSQGLDYLRLGYNEPLGYGGARWGLNTEYTHYTVISDSYDSLDLHGPSNSLSLYVSQPWIRRRDFSSDWLVTAEHKNFTNISTFSTSQYKVDNLTSTVSMTSQDSLWRGGENNASLQLQRGFVYYDTTNALDGGFTKWRLNMSRKNKINDSQALLLSYQRQWANRNLDSSEKFGIGGASSVRAYPGGEASGSEASQFTMEWQHDLQWNKQPYKLSAFYDVGSVTKYKYNDSGVANNNYSLQGVGLWIGTSIPNRWGQSQWRATWSHRLGSNPAALSSGSDADGTYYLNRFWLSASQVF